MSKQKSSANTLLRYIVPFYIDDASIRGFRNLYEYACNCFTQKTNESNCPQWTSYNHYGTSPDLYDFIIHRMSPEGEGESACNQSVIGQTWTHTEYLPVNWISNSGRIVELGIEQWNVTIFTTGIGCLWYQLERTKKTDYMVGSFEELIDFNHLFKELAQDSDSIIYPVTDQPFILTLEEFNSLISSSSQGVVSRAEVKRHKTTHDNCSLKGKILIDRDKVIEIANERNEEHKRMLSAKQQDNEDQSRLIRIEARKQREAQLLKYCNYVLLKNTETNSLNSSQRLTLVTNGDSLGMFITCLLTDTCEGIRFFSNVTRSKNGETIILPDKALPFCYVQTDMDYDETMKTTVCRLAKGFSNHYQIATALSDTTLQLFDNTRFYIGREGCAYLAAQNAADFYTVGFLHRIETVYFWIYMLLLQQSYSILNFARRIADQLPSCSNEYMDVDKNNKYVRIMDGLLMEMNTFLVKNQFSAVSGIHHINEFYKYGIVQLSIEEEKEGLYNGLQALANMQRARMIEEENKRKEVEAEERRLAKDAEDRRRQEEAEEHRMAKEAEDRRRQEEAEERRLAKEDADRRRQEAKEAAEEKRREEAEREKKSDEIIEDNMRRLSVIAIVSALCDSVGLIVGIRESINNVKSDPGILTFIGIGCCIALWIVIFKVGYKAIKSILEQRNDQQNRNR